VLLPLLDPFGPISLALVEKVVSMSAVASFLRYYTHNVDSSLFFCCFHVAFAVVFVPPFCFYHFVVASVQSYYASRRGCGRSIERSELKSESELPGALLGSVRSLDVDREVMESKPNTMLICAVIDN
jgi:hypothetical protein